MAKKTSKQAAPANAVPQKAQQVKRQGAPPAKEAAAPAKAATNAGWGAMNAKTHAVIALAIAIVTFLFLKVCLENQFTNWDDPGYVKDNALIKDLSITGLRNIFSTAIMGNYHPLTILSYAMEYSAVRLQPMLYHLDSLLFHIITTLLVYWFVALLTRRPIAAAITALLFGLHPMHMESVAWIAGRKDVVYGAFYMAACVAYVYYVRRPGKSSVVRYFVVMVLYICALLAKPVAVVLPLTLLLIDYYEQRIWITHTALAHVQFDSVATAVHTRSLNYRALLEKIPFFLLSVGFGIKSVLDQHTFGSLGTQNISYNYAERLALGGYALVTYLWKAVVPVGLACYYPYPEKVAGSTLSPVYYLYPVAVVAACVLLWMYGRKNRIVVFGTLFFLVNIALLLQFIPVGGAIVADRYSYIAYLGLFFIAGWYVSVFFEPGAKRAVGNALLAGTLAYTLVLGVLSNERCRAWYDPVSLWRDEIEKEPTRAPNAYNNLGFCYFNKYNDAVNQGEKRLYYDSAYYLLNKSISLDATFVNPYISLGELLRSAGKFNEAKGNYYKALTLKSFDEDGNAYLGLAIIYAISHNYDSAFYCFRTAIKLKPHFPEAISNYGNLLDMTGQHDSALVQYGIAIAQNPDMFAPYLNRGRALQRMNRINEAMNDFKAALYLSPDNGEIYYARSFCYASLKDKAAAVRDINKAVALGFNQVDPNYYQVMNGK